MRRALCAVGALIGLLLAGYPFTVGSATSLVSTLAGMSLACLVLNVFRVHDRVITLGAALLAAEYGVALYESGAGVDPFAPVVALLLYAYVELFDLAMALPDGARVEPRSRPRLVAGLVLPAGLSLLVAYAMLGLAALPLPGGTLLRVIGMACAVAVVAAPVVLLRRALPPRDG